MEANQLTSKDWIVLEHLAELLGFYEDAVRTLESDGQLRRRKRGWVGSYGNIWEVVQEFEFLLEALEKSKQLAPGIPDSELLRININLGWEKLNKYYRLLDETPIYWRCNRRFDGTTLRMSGKITLIGLVEKPAAKRQGKYYNPFQAYCERTRSVSGPSMVKEKLAGSGYFEGNEQTDDVIDELELW
ncbi:hypothetical protein NHJ13734_009485 [Beauveria thailandica]